MFQSGQIINSPPLTRYTYKPQEVGWDTQMLDISRKETAKLKMDGFHTVNMQFCKTSYNTATIIRGSSPRSTIVIAYIQSDDLVSYCNQRYEKNRIILLDYKDEFELIVSGRCTVFSIAIVEEFFFKKFFDYFGKSYCEISTCHHIYIGENYRGEFANFLNQTLDVIVDRDTIQSINFSHIENSIIEKILSYMTIDEDISFNYRHCNILQRAKDMIFDRLDDDFKISDTAKYLGISQKTLENLFKKDVGMTPKQYQQAIKLNRIREELFSSNQNETKVSDIALKYGYLHLGHFAAEYKRLFGESPSQTLKRSK